MFSFFSHKEKENLSLIFDIQSGLVRGALVINKGNEPTRIVSVVTKPIEHKPEATSAYLTKEMLKGLSEISERLAQGMKGSPESIHCVLASPWVFSQSKTLTLDFEKDTEITFKMVQNLVEEERRKLEETSKISNSDLIFIEQKIFEIKLNGYKVNSYDGKKARSLEISFAATLSSKKLLERINTALIKAMHGRTRPQYHSALLLNFLAMRSLVPERDNFVGVHIHSEMTDVIVVKNGLSAHLASFPFGTETLIRKMVTATKGSLETVESTLNLLEEGRLETSEENKINKIITPILNSWYEEYMKSVDHENDGAFLPKTVYLSAHQNVELFKKAIHENNAGALNVSFETTSADMHVTFDKQSEYSQLMGMYALAVRSMV